jgi:thiamine-monophosphate kinase
MCDVSDGLLADLGHVARDSRVVVDLDRAALVRTFLEPAGPLQQVASALGADPLGWVLTGGEDHALVATFRPTARLPAGWSGIGSVRAGGKKTGVFVDGVPATDVVRAVGAEGTGHVHFG